MGRTVILTTMRTRRAYHNASITWSWPRKQRKGWNGPVCDKKFDALYGIFREKNGRIEGYCENSFSMSWESERVALVSKEHAQRDFRKLHPTDPSIFIYRLSRRNGPIRIDWEKRHAELTEKDDKIRGRTYKYASRNAPFQLTPRGQE